MYPVIFSQYIHRVISWKEKVHLCLVKRICYSQLTSLSILYSLVILSSHICTVYLSHFNTFMLLISCWLTVNLSQIHSHIHIFSPSHPTHTHSTQCIQYIHLLHVHAHLFAHTHTHPLTFFFCSLKLSMMTPMKRLRVKKDPKMIKKTK